MLKVKINKNGDKSIVSSLLDAVAAPIFVLIHEKILYANPAAVDLSGLNPEDLIRQDFRHFIRVDETALYDCLKDLKSGECRASFKQAKGRELPINLFLEKIESEFLPDHYKNNSQALLVTVKELSPQQLLKDFKKPAESYNDDQDWDRLITENMRQNELLQKIFEVDSGGLAVLSGADLVFQSANPAYRALLPDPEQNPIGKKYEEVWTGEDGIRIRRVLEQVMEFGTRGHEERYEHIKTNGIPCFFSMYFYPLNWDGVPGVLIVTWDLTDLEKAQRQVEQSLHTARVRAEELEALGRVAHVLRNTIGQEEMCRLIVDHVLQLLNVAGASLLVPDHGSGNMIVKYAAGAWAQTTGKHIPEGKGISAQVMAEGQPYISNDIQKDPRLVTSVFAKGLKCGVCVALSSHGGIIGVIWIGSNTPIPKETVHLLSAIADIAASNLFRARLFDQTQLRLQRLSALHSIDMAITSSLDLNLTLGVLLEQVLSQMQVDAADILLFDPALFWLEFASGRGFLHPEVWYETLSLNDTPAGKVAMERRILSIPDISQSDQVQAGLFAREEGFRSYFAAPLIAKGQIKGVLELFHREEFNPDNEWLGFLETLSTQAAIAIDSAELFERLQQSNEELRLAYDATIEGWSRALELRNQETYGHAQRVTDMTIHLARRMGVRDDEIQHYRRGVLLHDIGKMAIPDSILLKDGPLTPEEQENMRKHPVYAYELLHPITYLRLALDIPYSHHEWWDGSGYPRGLKGEEIPLSARIFAVVDVWDALRSDRSYRPAWPAHKVVEHIRSLSGTHFDPRVVDEFIKMLQSSDSTRRLRSVFL
jgi:response regulator RpfG family c-di-GMP phosphodiesterase/PAS domain-containing protein/putative methionine-R-sulfoxide reductase with GAF domain